jgi:fructose-specific phosphotransferase system IIA component
MEKKELVDFFDESLFNPGVKAKNKNDAFEELVGLFVDARVIRNKDILLEMLKKRETLGSTGIGKNVAIPHGRTTAAIDVKIAFGRSEKGIEFEAVDGKPVHLIFVVLAPPNDENNKYLPVLGKLVEVVSEKENRDKLMKVQSYQDFISVLAGE